MTKIKNREEGGTKDMSKPKRILSEEEKQKIAEVKKELNEYRENIKYITGKIEDAEEVKGTVQKVTSTFSFNGLSGSDESKDRFADAISKLNDLEIECTSKMQGLLEKKFYIDDKIELVKQPYRNILFFRYTRGKGWNEVAQELGYTADYVFDLHGEALYQYSKIS